MVKRTLVLASTSPYRAQLLGRLGYPFSTLAPDVDESSRPNEQAVAKAKRLAVAKARAVQTQCVADAYVIGSDQVLSCAGQLLGKPGDFPRALAQLMLLSGKTAQFSTAVALVHQGRVLDQACIATTVRYRHFDAATATEYLRLETPYDCAGAAKVESLGIVLCAEVQSSDPTALIGLPLIATTSFLMAAGFVLMPRANGDDRSSR